MNKLPTDFNKDFVLDHINEVANIIRDALNDCASYVLEEKGDRGLSIAIRGIEWVRDLILKTVNSGKYSYLGIKRKGANFVISIDGVPVKFHKGDIDNLRSNITKISDIERLYLQEELFHFDNTDAPYNLIWRYVIDTNHFDRTVENIYMCGFDGSRPVCIYNVPLAKDTRILVDVNEPVKEAFDIEAPRIGLKLRVKKASNE